MLVKFVLAADFIKANGNNYLAISPPTEFDSNLLSRLC
jgi:hypothetical protein